MNLYFQIISLIITFSLGSSHHVHAMWNSIVYHCTPASWTVQKQIDAAIVLAKATTENGKVCAGLYSGIVKGISWAVIPTKNTSGQICIQVECSDPSITKIYQDKMSQGSL